jgi:DNA-binding transcriptional LysR family regulator
MVFDELRQAVQHIEFLSDPTVGELRIGSSVMLASGLVASIVDALTRRSPRMKFQLVGGETGSILRALENRQVDLVVTRLYDITLKDDFQTEVLHEEADVVIAGRTNALARRRSVGLRDLANEPWALPSHDSLFGGIADEAFRKAGMEVPSPAVVALTAPARLALVASGRFLAITPRSVLRFGVAKSLPLVILPIDLHTKRRPVCIVTLRGRTPNPIAPLFVSEALRLVGKLRI